MRRVIRKRVRHKEDGLDLALDFNADIAINVGRSGPSPVTDATPEAEREPEPPASSDPPEEGKSR
jgi:hypothetical protein